jgi:hypothetical protein
METLQSCSVLIIVIRRRPSLAFVMILGLCKVGVWPAQGDHMAVS